MTPVQTSLRAVRLLLGLSLALVLMSCSRGAPVSTQKLDIESGQFGIPDRAEVLAIDFIRFDDTNPRFDESVSLLAQEWLNRNRTSASRFIEDFTGEISFQLANALESEVRSRKCIYVVEPTSSAFMQIVNKDISTGQLTPADQILDFATEEELEFLDSLDDDEFDDEFARLVKKYEDSGEIVQELDKVAVASQCLLNLHVGDMVSIYKFDDVIALSPRR